MNTAVLQLGVWDQSPAKDCESAARSVAQRLPAPWQFTGLRFHEAGGQRRHVAFFDWNGLQFALVPGGTVTLGYDRGTPPVLTDTQRREYEEQSRAASGFPELSEYLDRCMTPLREVTLRPSCWRWRPATRAG